LTRQSVAQLAARPQADLAAAGDDHAPHRVVAPAQRVEHAPDVACRRQHEDLVAGLDAGRAVAQDLAVAAALVGAVDRDEAHRAARHQLRQLGDDVADHRPPLIARTAIRLIGPRANSSTCSASGYSTSLWM
jgi:hypothetical protein